MKLSIKTFRNMNSPSKPLPLWILVVSALFALMEIAVSFTICFSPQSVLETVDVSAKGVDYLFYMWGTRQFALGFIFAFATYKRSIPMLTIAYIFFLVMFVGDLLIGIKQNEMSMIVSALVMCAISVVMLYVLNKKNRI